MATYFFRYSGSQERKEVHEMKTKLKESLGEKEALYSLLVNAFKRTLGMGKGNSAERLTEDREQTETLNPHTYIIANQRLQEIETQKAMIASLARHEKWKAGGPV